MIAEAFFADLAVIALLVSVQWRDPRTILFIDLPIAIIVTLRFGDGVDCRQASLDRQAPK